MKKLITTTIASLAVFFSGCNDLPSADTIGNLSKAIGYAAGVTCNLAKMSEKAKKTTVEVLDIVAEVVPAKGQSFTDAWTPIVKETVAKFVAEGKIDQGEGDLIVFAMGVVTKGIDYMFDVRWPKAREYTDLVSAGTKGFVEGFKSVMLSSAKNGELPYDKEEYDKAVEFLKK